MRDKLLLLVYLLSVIYLSCLGNVVILLIGFCFLLTLLSLIPVKNKLELLKHSFFSFFLFSFVISFSYLLLELSSGNKGGFEYFLMVNLRSFEITFLTFLFLRVANLYKAFDFSKTLTFLLVITVSNILMYNKLLKDFKDALKSRILEKPTRQVSVAFIKRLSLFFFDKSINISREVYQAMKSRGFYDD
ncbi:MAG: ABC transporter permease [Aquificaceae bacterium]